MISWLQINLQKHFRIVFIILLVGVIVSFVFMTGNQPGLSGAEREALANRRFFDTPLNSSGARQVFERDAALSAQLGGRRFYETYPYERATALYLANLHKVPAPTNEQFSDFIQTRPIFLNGQGAFDPQAYSMMIDYMQLQSRQSEADMRRVLEDDYRIEKVIGVLEGPGAFDKNEALGILEQRRTVWSVMVASIDLGDYTPDVDVSEAQLQEFYIENGENYRTPVRRAVDYVSFGASAYVDQIDTTDLEDELIAYYEINRARYQPDPPPPPAEGEEPPPVETVEYEQVRSMVRDDYRFEKATEIAQERAHQLVINIIENEIGDDSEAFHALLELEGLAIETTPAFAQSETPIGTTWGAQIRDEAFKLTPTRYYSEPIEHAGESIVLFFNSEIESIIPMFDGLRTKIYADYVNQELGKLRQEYAGELAAKLHESTASEDVFGVAAEEAGLTVQTFREFTAMEPAESLNPRLLSQMTGLEVAEVSDFTPTGNVLNQGAFLYALSKEAPEVAEDDPELKMISQSLMSNYKTMAANQYISKLMQAEMARMRQQ